MICLRVAAPRRSSALSFLSPAAAVNSNLMTWTNPRPLCPPWLCRPDLTRPIVSPQSRFAAAAVRSRPLPPLPCNHSSSPHKAPPWPSMPQKAAFGPPPRWRGKSRVPSMSTSCSVSACERAPYADCPVPTRPRRLIFLRLLRKLATLTDRPL